MSNDNLNINIDADNIDGRRPPTTPALTITSPTIVPNFEQFPPTSPAMTLLTPSTLPNFRHLGLTGTIPKIPRRDDKVTYGPPPDNNWCFSHSTRLNNSLIDMDDKNKGSSDQASSFDSNYFKKLIAEQIEESISEKFDALASKLIKINLESQKSPDQHNYGKDDEFFTKRSHHFDDFEPASQKVNFINPKLSPVWREYPELWFKTQEAHFENINIKTQQAKYTAVVGVLTSDLAALVSDILGNPDQSCPYDILKKELIARLGLSDTERIQNVIRGMDLGDKKPSQLLRDMQAQAQNAFAEATLRIIWEEKLPHQVRTATALSTESVNKVALMADKVYEIYKGPRIATVTDSSNLSDKNSCSPSSSDNMSFLVAALDKLQKQVDELSKTSSNNDRSRSTERDKSKNQRKRSPSPTLVDGLCYYHRNFGDKAKKCIPECKKFDAIKSA